MALGRVNTGGGGSGGTLTVNAPAGVTVTAAKDGRAYARTANEQGVAVFQGLATGIWAVTISDGVQNPTTQYVQIKADYSCTIAFFAATIAVTYPAGSTCTCAKGAALLTAPDQSGSAAFTVPEAGDWVVSCTDGTDTADQTVAITEDGQEESVDLGYQLYASDFTVYLAGTTTPAVLGTDYEVVYDDDNAIDQSLWHTTENWKYRCLVNIDVVPLKDGEIDVFAVGGGGGSGPNWSGGGGGYTSTVKYVEIFSGIAYPIVVGSSGGTNTNGGDTEAFGTKAAGGKNPTGWGGGNGGSGGAGSGHNSRGRPGTDGNDGMPGNAGEGGLGQRNNPGPNGETGSTREFGEETGTLYATGGYTQLEGYDGDMPLGSGYCGGSSQGLIKPALPGIVVFRNARTSAETTDTEVA